MNEHEIPFFVSFQFEVVRLSNKYLKNKKNKEKTQQNFRLKDGSHNIRASFENSHCHKRNEREGVDTQRYRDFYSL